VVHHTFGTMLTKQLYQHPSFVQWTSHIPGFFCEALLSHPGHSICCDWRAWAASVQS